jgi:hypothetical protein
MIVTGLHVSDSSAEYLKTLLLPSHVEASN